LHGLLTGVWGSALGVEMNRAKLAMLASTSLCLSFGFANAADMPVKARVAPVAVVDPWVGWYVGGNIGYSWGKTDTATNVGGVSASFGSFVFPQAASTTSSNVNGVIGGVQAGYVGRIAPTWLGGVEADFQGSGQKGSARGVFGGDGLYCTTESCSFAHANDITAKLNWFGTFRGRVGPEINGVWFYGTAGVAYGQVSVSGTNTAVFVDNSGPTVVGASSTPYSYSQLKGGWTAGVGAEGLIGNGPWRWKVEYLHIDLGNINGGTFGAVPFVQVNTTRFTDEIVRVGFNYKFDDGRPAANMPVKAIPPALFAWTGWYVGVNAGYIDTVGRTNTNALSAANDDPETAIHLVNTATNQFNDGHGGFIGGAQVGYNYQFSPSFVAGLEADFQGTTLRRDRVATNAEPAYYGVTWTTTSRVSNSLDWLGTVRGRVGVTPTPSLLIYSTGGLAYGGVRSNTQVGFNNSIDFFPGVTSGSVSDTRVGWTAGGGLEWMFAPNWSAKLEYLYYDLGSVSYATGAYDSVFGPATIATRTSTRFEGNIARVGVNYQFGGGPVVAKY
jgi:outer membrane immunogenic protein